MASNSWPMNQPIDWAALQAFAAEQQRLEQSGSPSTLTPAQRAAIYTLIPPPAIQQAGAVVEDNINYIGHLNQYLQKHHPGTSLNFTEESFTIPKPTGSGFDIAWHCKCVVPAPQTREPLSFPVAVNGQAPATFLRKQQARQFAAYSACAYLHLNGALLLPMGAKLPDASAANAPPPPTASQASQPRPAPQPAPAALTPALPGPAQPNPALEALLADRAKKEILARVNILAHELKLPPPAYTFSQSYDGSWTALCEFSHPKFPDGLGSVRGAESLAAAQKQAAEMVYQWLEGEKARREEMYRSMTG